MVLDGLMRTTLHGLREVGIFLYPGQTTQGMPGSFWGDSPTAGRTLTQQNMGGGDQQDGETEDGGVEGDSEAAQSLEPNPGMDSLYPGEAELSPQVSGRHVGLA